MTFNKLVNYEYSNRTSLIKIEVYDAQERLLDATLKVVRRC